MNAPRGFEPVKGKTDVILPQRATAYSAGYDFYCPINKILPPHKTTFITTNVKAFMQNDEVLKIYSRSSLATQRNIVVRNGVAIIDADYYGNQLNDGNIVIPLYNDSCTEFLIKKFERFAQGIFEKYLTADDVVEAEREGGFGSSGS